MSAVTTTIDAATGGLEVSWDVPSATGGIAITSYLIEVKASDNSWNADSACDGSSETVLNARTCVIPMASLAASPHSLSFDVLVELRASAANGQGYGPVSSTNTSGARTR